MEDIALATTVALQKGLAALAKGDPTAALAHFENALNLDPGASTAAWHRALTLSALDRRAEAQEALQAVVEAQPSNTALLALANQLASPQSSGEWAPTVETIWHAGDVIDHRWEVFGSTQGGMGRVYFVRDVEWEGIELAMKSLSLRAGASPEEAARVRAMFRRETQIWLDLGAHPHIVSGFYTLEVQGALRFFMEYVPGRPLDAVLRIAQQGLAQAHALDLAIQLAAGVEFLHARAVVHRDLKPGNCLIMEDGTLRVTDFGLGKITGEAELPLPSLVEADNQVASLSIPGAGTPWYMAPEQWRSLGDAGAAADVYAFGALLHELLTGARVFDTTAAAMSRYAGHIPAFMRSIIDGPRASRELILWLFHAAVPALGPRSLNPTVLPALDQLVVDCLAKDPAARPSIHEVSQRLRRAFEEVTGGVYPRDLRGAFEATESSENNRAVSYFAMGDVRRAEAILSGWLARDPLALRPWINRQTVALREGTATAARVAMELERRIVPAHPMAMAHDRHVRAFRARLKPWAPFTEGPASAVSLDDQRLAASSGDAIHLIDRGLGEVVRTLLGHRASVSAIALSHDGRLLLSGSYDRTARVWEAGSGRLLRTLEGHRGPVLSVALDAGARRAAAGGGASYDTHGATGASVRVWDTTSGRLLAVLRGHHGSVRALAFSPDGERLATGSNDGTVLLWDVAESELLYAFEAPGDAVFVGFSQDGTRLIGAHRDGPVRVWDARDGRELHTLGASWLGLTHAAWATGTDVIAAGYADGAVRLFSGRTGAQVRALAALEHPVSALGFDPTGHRLAVGGEEGVMVFALQGDERMEDLVPLIEAPVSARGFLERTRERELLEARITTGDPAAFESLKTLRDRTLAWQREAELSTTMHRAARAFGVTHGIEDAWSLRSVELSAPVHALRFDAGGTVVLVGEAIPDGMVMSRWDLLTGAVAGGLAELPPLATAVAFSGDAHRALVSTSGGSLLLCRSATGKALRRVTETAQRITAIALSPDGAVALAGYEDGTVRLWSTARPELLKTLRGHRFGVTSAAFSPDGALAITGSWDETARVWELASGRAAHVLSAERAGVSAVAFSPCGRRFLVCNDRHVTVFDTALGRPESVFRGHSAAVASAAILPDGRHAITGAWDATARVWRLADGVQVRAMEGHAYGVTAVAASPDGHHVVTGGADQRARQWAIDWLWSFGGSLEDDARGVLGGARDSRHWPHAVESRSVDALCDVWRDLASALPPERLTALWDDWRDAIRRSAAAEPEGALLSVESRLRAVGVVSIG